MKADGANGSEHDELCRRAVKWLRNTKRCGVVLSEFHSFAKETPDAIGWTSGACMSYLVECKTSRSDFYADKKKPGRAAARAVYGMGRRRYYMTEPKLLIPYLIETRAPGWGLLEVHDRIVKVVKESKLFGIEARIYEIPMLFSYARRVEQYGIPLDRVQKILSGENRND